MSFHALCRMRRGRAAVVLALAPLALALSSGITSGETERDDHYKLLVRAHFLAVRFLMTREPAVKSRLHGGLRETVALLANDLPELKFPAGKTATGFQKVAVNARGGGFDGIVFTAPPGPKPWNLTWECATPEPHSFRFFNIVPVEGEMQGFSGPDEETDFEATGEKRPPGNYCLQMSLPTGQIQPGKKYVVWMLFNDEKPLDFHVRVTLRP